MNSLRSVLHGVSASVAIKQAQQALELPNLRQNDTDKYLRKVLEIAFLLNETVGAEVVYHSGFPIGGTYTHDCAGLKVIGNQDTSLNIASMLTPLSQANFLKLQV